MIATYVKGKTRRVVYKVDGVIVGKGIIYDSPDNEVFIDNEEGVRAVETPISKAEYEKIKL